MRPPSKMSRHFWYQSSAKSGHTYHFRTITFRISPTSSATTYYDCIPKKPRRLNRSLSTTTSKQRDQSTPIRDTVLLIDQTQEIITIAARRNLTACPTHTQCFNECDTQRSIFTIMFLFFPEKKKHVYLNFTRY